MFDLEVAGAVQALRLVDHHCHGVLRRDLDRPAFEALLTQGRAAEPAWFSRFDSALGFALRRWCGPVLDLPPHAVPEDYLRRRAELGVAEVTRRMLSAAGLAAVCVDTGYTPEPLLAPGEVGVAAHASAFEVLRLEQVAEQVAASGTGAADFADAVRDRLAAVGPAGPAPVVAVKSIAAYRVGLDLAGERPTETEVRAAVDRWLRLSAGPVPRLADEVLHRFLIWVGVDLGLPVQVHVGYGDRDLDLRRCDPLRLLPLLRAVEPTGVPVLLLHNYPFHRQAAYLAQVFPNVFMDLGLATHNVGYRSPALLAEALELAPFGKVLYSSDAFGLPELYHLGAVLFRQALGTVLGGGVAEGQWRAVDAVRVADLIGATNARHVYRLPRPTPGPAPRAATP